MCSDVKWKEQISSVSNKVKKKNGYNIKELREILSEKDMRITYLALVESITADGIIAWGVLTNTSSPTTYISQNTMILVDF